MKPEVVGVSTTDIGLVIRPVLLLLLLLLLQRYVQFSTLHSNNIGRED